MAIKRLYDTLVGATVRANQLLHNMRQSATQNGLTFTNTNGSLTITGTITEAFSYDYVPFTDAFTQFIRDGRKYLITLNKAIPYAWGVSGYSPRSESVNSSTTMFTNTAGGIWENGLVFRAPVGTTVNITDLRANIVDITSWLGSTIADYLYNLETATAGAGIAKLREWGFFTGGYIPYNPGSLESVEARSHVMRGFNQWDEEWEVGSIDNNGQNVAYAGNMRSKNYIRVLPNTQYFATPKLRIVIYWYDGDKKYISMSSASDTAITSPSNAQYMRFRTTDAYGGAYNNDICINLSSDRNGEYEPYSAHTYDLGTDTLRGLFKLDSNNNLYADGDTKASDGTVTRKRGRVVFDGSEGWLILDGNTHGTCFALNVSVPFVGWGDGGYKTALSNTFNKATISGTTTDEQANTFWWNTARTAYRVVWGTTTATVAEFKAYLNEHNLMIEGELATPTTEQSTPFQNPQICDPDGTEEYITDNGIPVGHETRYQL